MSKRLPAWLALLALLVSLILAGCSSSTPPPEPPVAELVPTSGAYAALVGEHFDINLSLAYSRLAPLEREDVASIELLPANTIVNVVGVRSFAQAMGNQRARRNLSIELAALSPGEHTFTSLVLHTASASYDLPLGNLHVQVVDGASPGFYVVFQTRGILDTVQPFELTFTNPTGNSYRFREIIPTHPDLAFSANDIMLVDSNGVETPLPSDGLTLAPQERIQLHINWRANLPADTPSSIELRPLAVLEGPEGVVYIPLANVIFRNPPALIQPL